MVNSGSKLVGVFMLLFLFCLSAVSPASAKSFPDIIPLPDGFRPEGIVIGTGHTAYAGSLGTGDIYAINLRSGERELLVTGPGTPSVGMSYDDRSGYLFVAGGNSGTARVYASDTGALIADLALGGAFVNDAVITNDAAYFTDSFAPQLYKVGLSANGQLTGVVEIILLGGDYVQAQGFNTNGIVATPNNDALIIVQTATAKLFKVDPATGIATEIEMIGSDATNGDGLVLSGQTLYVVQNRLNRIAKFKMSGDYSTATLQDTITSSAYDIPTTADLFGASIYAVNARFGTASGPDASYDIVKAKR